MRFTKMHGAGNDYVYVNGFVEPYPDDPAGLARAMAHRRFGVGGDGLILILPSEVADARMQMFNADGSEAEMCGNGIRCVAKYVYDHEICKQDSLRIETGAGVLSLQLAIEDGLVDAVTVDMGEPILAADRIPTLLEGDPVVDQLLDVDGRQLKVTCVSMGNPHCIVFVENATDELVLGLGPKMESDRRFPARVNVEFVEVVSPTEVRQRTWERGSARRGLVGQERVPFVWRESFRKRTERKITNHLLGGDLTLEWRESDHHVYMTGPAREVFSGQWP